MEKPLILVTNDDGVNAPGIRCLIDIMSEIHELIEKWIKKNPDQWLWQHKRFD